MKKLKIFFALNINNMEFSEISILGLCPSTGEKQTLKKGWTGGW